MPEYKPPSSLRHPSAGRREARKGSENQVTSEQLRRLDALAHLSSEVAHDVNNALQVIKAAHEILRRRFPRTEDADGIFDMLARNTNRTASLMQRLIAFAGRLPLEPRVVNVNRLVAGMADQMREAAGAGVAIETALDGGLWSIFADPDGLQTALLILGANSRDAMSHGGKIAIETRNASLDNAPVVTGKGSASGEYVAVTVRDTGAGMPPEIIAKVFDPYFTTKETAHGTGLGLSQVYGFMKQSNGHISIDSAPGRGTDVTLYFPRLAPADLTQMPIESAGLAAGADPTGNSTAAIELAGLRVLVIEDESLIGMLVGDLLDQLGCQMIGMVSGVDRALEMTAHVKIDLVLLDVDLGGEPSYPVAEALQARGIPFVFMTGLGGLEPPWRGRPVIQKPFELAQFRSVIESALGDVR